jgi:hypothetical protein
MKTFWREKSQQKKEGTALRKFVNLRVLRLELRTSGL